jgi:DNA-binding HxlR family transcriptional regulator
VTYWTSSRQQAVFDAVNLLDGQWTVPVVYALASGELQDNGILAAISVDMTADDAGESDMLSLQVLADTLQRATKDGLIEHVALDGTVRYRLTAKGRALLQALAPMADWARMYCGPASTT